MIKFVIRAKKNPLNRTQIKFYPQMAPGAPVMLRTIVGRIEKRSGVSSTRVRDKVSMQTVLTALIFQHKQAEPQVYCQKSNRLLGQNIGS